MSHFPDSIVTTWRKPFLGDTIHRDSSVSLVVIPRLDEDRSVTVLRTAADSHTAIAVLPDVVDRLESTGLFRSGPITEARVREALVAGGITLHGADNLYYLPAALRAGVTSERDREGVRLLSPADTEAFGEFESRATEQDLDDAQVGIDDWAAFGAFGPDGRLSSAGSMYPWGEGAVFADIGVLTLAEARGQGQGRAVVRAMMRHALSRGLEPQYRCQLDNVASVALAAASGLALFGTWEVPTPEDDPAEDDSR
ncbi:GNAT family N-acetyltransferase [Oerskovia enterophila]|uniref:N-acetyltransferase domain-containing protein n=1 Tax=Oerskovia enterophila TaxID=43678 RepID=A0A163RGV9_9CELL|nr:GNAT family N-acetyltransferase [Oerskovia enterophila]KZM35201.1 hypothetical protein OJAG_21690 [Oerskovia enterophila]